MDNIRQELNSLSEKIMQYQFPIFVKKKNKHEQQGTCTLLRIEDHFFIVTAGHVTNLRHISQDNSIYIYNHSSNEFIRITEDIFGVDSEQIENYFDVSIIKIDRNNYKNILDESFVTATRLLLPNMQIGKHKFMATGYPSSKNRSFPKFKHRTKACVLLTHKIEGDNSAIGELLNINLSYEAQDSPIPNGMSGGAIWILTKDLPCNPALAGILVAYNSEKNSLIGVKTDYVIAMIKAFIPGTLLDEVAIPFFIRPNENGSKIYLSSIPQNHQNRN